MSYREPHFLPLNGRIRFHVFSFRSGDLIRFNLHKIGKIYLTHLTKYAF